MRLRFDLRTVTLASLLLLTTMGHGGEGCCHEESVLGPRTETPCPTPPTTLTYDNFGMQFMDMYCVGCHSSLLTGEDRMGATLAHDFDTLLGIRSVAEHIDQTAGIGPAAENRNMPPSGELQPTDEERRMLAEWIACGAPN